MPPDTETKERTDAGALRAARPAMRVFESGDAPTLPPGVTRYVAPRDGYLATLTPPKTPPNLARFVSPVRKRFAALTDHLSETTKRRARAAFALALALNVIVLTLLSFYGVVRIWIPGAPGATHVVMLDLPPTPLPLPDLRDAEAAPTPPEPVEPEIVEKPKIKPEPEPVPAPQDKAEPPPAPEEPAPAPPPVNLDREPDFAPPEEPAPTIPSPSTPAPEEAPDVSVGKAPEPEPQPQPQGAQEPAETPEPLVTQGARPDEGAQGQDAAAEEARRKQEEEAARRAAEAKVPEAAPASGDDAFDEAPAIGERAPLPTADLPAGAASGAPGSSGVVAIYCPKQFSRSKDKAAECAGRTEIRSGWRPGASGEDWSKAVELLKQARSRGQGGSDANVTFTPGTQRRLDEGYATRDGAPRIIGRETAPKGGLGGVEAPAPQPGDNLDAGIDRSQSAPKDFTPANQRRDRAPLSEAEQKKLREQLEKARREKPN